MTSRRAFLAAAGLLGIGALTGCSLLDPTIVGRTAAPGTGSAVPDTGIPYRDEGVTALSRVEGLARGVQAATEQRLTSAQTALLAWVVPALAAQRAAVIRGTPVTDETPSPGASPSPSTGATWQAFVGELSASASGHARRAAGTRGADSLLWASLAGFAQSVADHPGTTTRSTALVPALPVVGSEADALTDVVTQLHVLVFGVELALVPLRGSDAAYEQISSAQSSWMQYRDDLSETLRSLGAPVPGSRAPYDIAAPESAAAATTLVADLETRFLPTAGVWVAAADSTHPAALDLLAAATAGAASFGGKLQVWPGWPTR
ncbi:DUF4439 domain-containing protein [Propionicicella superfundia]|uniref:DUF4439 domain-containing protein n=1 Tax=Propionicicella superfundia TaxID=348582 RepID=UPI00041DD9F6|nr:DUF4439 domain-containing protein [Propionicicella superfundia]